MRPHFPSIAEAEVRGRDLLDRYVSVEVVDRRSYECLKVLKRPPGPGRERYKAPRRQPPSTWAV